MVEEGMQLYVPGKGATEKSVAQFILRQESTPVLDSNIEQQE